ncbi:MAG: hypothetical protein JST00_22490 [Deltaproteobacteria bacterium]|nr:hypothetical protein [Deltaproteobacteria bacterium]
MNEESSVARRYGAGARRTSRIMTVTLLVALVALVALPTLGCRGRSRGAPAERPDDTPDPRPVTTTAGTISQPTPISPPITRSSPPPSGTRSFTTSSSFVVPFGVTTLRIAVNAGGGGGGASCTSRRPGGSGIGHRESNSFAVTPGDILDVSITPPERGRCGGGNGGRGGSATVRGRGVHIFASGGVGGIGTGGGCAFCGGDGGPSSAVISW